MFLVPTLMCAIFTFVAFSFALAQGRLSLKQTELSSHAAKEKSYDAAATHAAAAASHSVAQAIYWFGALFAIIAGNGLMYLSFIAQNILLTAQNVAVK